MNRICLKLVLVVISFPKIIFEIEHYECKSRMMHENEAMCGIRLQTSFFFCGRGGPDIKRYELICLFIPDAIFWTVPNVMVYER